MTRNPLRKPVQGLSLIEVMIALAIGSLLLIGLIQVFAASRTSSQLAQGMARSQENARFAIEFLQRDLRMAGHFGCINDTSHVQAVGGMVNMFPTASGATWGIDFPRSAVGAVAESGASIRGYDATNTTPGQTLILGAPAAGWTPGLPAAIAALAPLPGSDVIELRFLSHEGVLVSSIVNPTAAQTLITIPAAQWDTLTENGVASPTMFGLTDCSYADVFPAAAVNAAAGTVLVNQFISRHTSAPAGQATLYRAESMVYYIANGASGLPALWRARSNSTGSYIGANSVREELVEGIENMQLLFGLDATPNLTLAPPTGFMAVQQPPSAVANTPANWRRVGLVQVGLLARSPGYAALTRQAEAGNEQRSLGVIFAPPAVNDGVFRTSYETTVALRNRLYGN